MDFAEQLKSFAEEIRNKLSHITSEALTQSALVEPFLRQLGYDPSNPAEVVPQYGANLNLPGVKKDKHVDYGVLKNGVPIILIEVKPYGKDPAIGLDQLYDYFHKVHEVKVGIATNGVIWRFYSDLEKPNIMDQTPYLEMDLLNLKDSDIEAIKKLTKSAFDLNEIITAADELKYTNGILQILRKQLIALDDEFVKFFFKQLYQGPFTGQMKEKFLGFTNRALKQFIKEQIYKAIATGIGEADSNPQSQETPDSENKEQEQQDSDVETSKITTTDEELEAYYIVKSVLRNTIDPRRITYKDTQSYCNVLLDDNTWKPICRLYLNNPQNKKLELVTVTAQREKEYEKISINDVNDIYQYADRLKTTLQAYENQ